MKLPDNPLGQEENDKVGGQIDSSRRECQCVGVDAFTSRKQFVPQLLSGLARENLEECACGIEDDVEPNADVAHPEEGSPLPFRRKQSDEVQ